MYGHFNQMIKDFVISRFGENTWDHIIQACGCARDYKGDDYFGDDTTQELIDTSVQVLDVDRDQFLMLLGEHYLDAVRARYDELLRNLGDNMLTFLENLDYLHTYIMNVYPDLNMPSFRCETASKADDMVVHYYSYRAGLYPLVEGILQAVARVYFKSDLHVTILSRTTEEVSTRGAVRHHVVFSIRVSKIKPREAAPPTLIAQTKKGNERQIHKTDIERVLLSLQEIKETQGEDALPLNRGKAARAKWRALAKMSVLFSGFVPQYPMQLTISAKSFCDSFPYHVVFDKEMAVIHSGIKLQQLMPGIRNLRVRITEYLVLLHPNTVSFTFENVSKFINTPFLLRTQPSKMEKKWGKKPMVKLRGQMVHADGGEHLIFLASPYLRSLRELEERNMKLSDIPIHDVTRDLLWMEFAARGNGNRSSGAGSYGTLCRRNEVTVGISGTVVPPSDDDSINSNDPNVLRRLLMAARQEVADERQKRDDLLQAFLPTPYFRDLQEREERQAGNFQAATVLFSDVVSFAKIIAQCEPRDVVQLLTDLHQMFNRICKVHQTFRVEAIGDAYMVVSGGPDRLETHPERLANTALGMMLAAREVMSPLDYDDNGTSVKIRIGMCTGEITCGVVGDITPRCLVFGAAVNQASRLESHGVPGRIQTNQKTRDILKSRGFRLEKRGTIDLRGQGRVKTFFLEANTRCSEDELLGRRGSRGRTANAVEVTFVNNGRLEHPASPRGTNGSNSPLLSSNKVSPINAFEMSVRSSLTNDDESLVLMSYPDTA